MFNLDIKSDGMSWFDNICQKIEALCEDVDGTMMKETTKYIESQVQTGCNNVRNYCVGIMQDLLPNDSDLSLIYEADCDIEKCKNSKVGSPVDDKTSAPTKLDVFDSSGKKDSRPAESPDKHFDLMGEACGEQRRQSVESMEEVRRCDFLERPDENALNNICDVPEPMSALSNVSLEKGHEKKFNTDVTNSALPSEFERPIRFVWKEASSGFEAIEEFEDLPLEEIQLHTISVKDVLISSQEQKKITYKKMLRNALISKLRSLKRNRYQQTETPFATADELERCTMSPISVLGNSSIDNASAPNTSDSGWELV